MFGWNRRHLDMSKLDKIKEEDPDYQKPENALIRCLEINELTEKNKYNLMRFQSDNNEPIETDKSNQSWQDKLVCESTLTLWFKDDKARDEAPKSKTPKNSKKDVSVSPRKKSTGNVSRRGDPLNQSYHGRRLTALADRFERVREYQSGTS